MRGERWVEKRKSQDPERCVGRVSPERRVGLGVVGETKRRMKKMKRRKKMKDGKEREERMRVLW